MSNNRFSVLSESSNKSTNTFKNNDKRAFRSNNRRFRNGNEERRQNNNHGKYVPPSQRRRNKSRSKFSYLTKKKTTNFILNDDKLFPCLGSPTKTHENDNTSNTQRMNFVSAINEKIKKKKEEKSKIPKGWVLMKRKPDGTIQKTYNPSGKKVDKELIKRYALLRLFHDEKIIRERQWLEAGYWDNHIHELEEIYDYSSSESEDEDMDFDYYDSENEY